MTAYILSLLMDQKILENSKNVKFADLLKLCKQYFGEPRIAGSHHIFKTPWKGKPFVNIQKDGKMAKPYQVKQIMEAINKMEEKDDKNHG